nr:apolipoprotein N-acyltransferase [Deinococcus koreensis]
MSVLSRLSIPLQAAALGALLAACSLPLAWSALAALPLAGVLYFAAQPRSPREVTGRLFWSGLGLFTVHLWWLTAFLGNIFGVPLLGVLAFALYALEGAFLAVMAYPLARLLSDRAARVWALAGGWVILEFLRFLGPLAFPWPTLGYGLLPTPAIQIADLGGVLLGSVLVALSAASLAHFFISSRWTWGRGRPLMLSALAWALALGYGLTRTPGAGPEQPVQLLRTTFPAFSRASGELSPDEEVEVQRNASRDQRPGEITIWSETALLAPTRPDILPTFPGPGISGVGARGANPQGSPNFNAVAGIDATGGVTSWNEKAKLVPFGEYFPLYQVLRPAYGIIENSIGFILQPINPNRNPRPLTLGGVRYGAYICYDSVFPWVARNLARQGAQLLVNPSNDGWYQGWGVQQHFNMGRVRAIETRRWIVRSVNLGVAGSVNDLGQPVQTVSTGETVRALHVRPRLLSGQTLYMRVGDLPALLLAALMVAFGFRLEQQSRRRW